MHCHITKHFMHSFEVDIRICQPDNSDVQLGFASVNITFLRLTNPDVNLKRMHQLYNDMITVAFSENKSIGEIASNCFREHGVDNLKFRV